MSPAPAEVILDPDSLASLYIGISQHAIDGSNRIILPSDWRVPGTPRDFFVIQISAPHYLVVCPKAIFNTFRADLKAGTADKTEIAQIDRALTELVRPVRLDPQGRLPLPSDLMAGAGIAKQGKLVGRFSQFEIWAPEIYQTAQAVPENVAKMVREKLKLL